MSPPEVEATAVALHALAAQVAEAQSRLIEAAVRAGTMTDSAGESHPVDWLDRHTHCGRREARHSVAWAARLARHEVVAEGMRAGQVSREQAEVICGAVESLPDGLDPEVWLQAEKHLVALAADFDPRQLRVLGRRVLEAIAPELADAHEARVLMAQEDRANQLTRLSLQPLGDGCTRIHGVLPDLVATRLANYLAAFTSPRHRGASDDAAPATEATHATEATEATGESVWWRLPYPRRLGEAFCELIERINPNDLPQHGVETTHLIVTIPLEALRNELGAANVLGAEGVEAISASDARRLACGAGIIPVVLGGKDEVLNLGRTRRLASRAQKRALMATHATCQAEGCDKPAAWTEVHHLTPWSQGGKTDHNDLVLLCSADHRRIHRPDHGHEPQPDGRIRFHRKP